MLAGQGAPDLSTTIAGQSLELLILLAPTGSAGLTHWTGEIGVAQAAERSGTLSIASTAPSYSFEEIAAATERDHFVQVFPRIDGPGAPRDRTLASVNPAKDQNLKAMFVTVDVPTPGNRESERKRGCAVHRSSPRAEYSTGL